MQPKTNSEFSTYPDRDMSDLFGMIREWGENRNILSGATPTQQALKGVSEYGEFADAVLKGDEPKIIDGIGDIVVILTIVAAQCGLRIEDCIEMAYDEIKDRKGVMYNGAFIKESDARYEAILLEIAAGSL